MTWGSYGYEKPSIVWVKTIDQLDEPYPYDEYYIKTVFAKYHIIDVTHDNKLVGVKASPKTAEEKKQKQLAYKKHKDCEVIVKEVDLQASLVLNLSNVFGTDACVNRVGKLYNQPTPLLRDNIIVDRNINMKLKVDKVEVDKNIITKTEKAMRLTVLNVSDVHGNTTSITLFDNDIVDKINTDELTIIKVTNAEVNMRKYNDHDDPMPEGLKIPSWAKIEVADGFDISDTPSKSIQVPTQNKDPVVITGLVKCEQQFCARANTKLQRFASGADEQYFCTKCNMSLCNICIFEHRADTSLSGLTCDNEICRGSRSDNGFSEVIEN